MANIVRLNYTVDEINQRLGKVGEIENTYATKDETRTKISVWQPDTEYKVGNIVVVNFEDRDVSDPVGKNINRTVIAKCNRDHTSTNSFALNNHESGIDVKDAWEILQETYAYYDALGNRIHNTYATKEELNTFIDKEKVSTSLNKIVEAQNSFILIDSGICNDKVCWRLNSNYHLTIWGKGLIGHAANAVPWINYKNDITGLTIKNGITTIDSYLFQNYSVLNDITIPDNLISIGVSAFSGTNYYKDPNNWENDVLYIGNNLIRARNSISDNYQIKTETTVIASWAFGDCSKLTSITIPEGITNINENVFTGCSGLTTVNIPKSVVIINKNAFLNCSSITTVNYEGSEEDKKKISINETGNTTLINAAWNCKG